MIIDRRFLLCAKYLFVAIVLRPGKKKNNKNFLFSKIADNEKE